MALLTRNLVVVAKKFTLSSFNCFNLYRTVCIPWQVSYTYLHNDVALGGTYQIYEKKFGLVYSQNLDTRKKFSDENERTAFSSVADYGRIQNAYGDLLKELSLKDTETNLEKVIKCYDH